MNKNREANKKLSMEANERWKNNKRDQIDVLDCIGGDLPDGAYFAMAEEMGIGIEDFI